MSEPRFLDLCQVERLHDRAIAEYGGTYGIRDAGGLESAIAQPRQLHHYTGADLFEIAAGYAFHIAQAQAFLDGNKRAGLAAATTFLRLNGVTLRESTEEFVGALNAVAERKITRTDIANIFRKAA